MWNCPVCRQPLVQDERTFCCPAGHRFDRARSGYANLLISNQRHGKTPGDNKLMVAARQRFLSGGFYRPLADRVAATVAKHTPSGGNLLDIGCGEGYYTNIMASALPGIAVYGIDISKTAVDKAARCCPNGSFVVASAFHIPVADHAFSTVTNLFAPYCGNEICRALRRDGVFVLAIPGEEHLWELKQLIYSIPYKNQVKAFDLEGFDLIESEELTYSMDLPDRETISDLFMMTPYYYKTGLVDQKKAETVSHLRVTAHFHLLTYRVSNQ